MGVLGVVEMKLREESEGDGEETRKGEAEWLLVMSVNSLVSLGEAGTDRDLILSM